MRRVARVCPAVLLLVSALAVQAGSFEDGLRAQWRGAWALTEIESWSDCSGNYFNNDVSGQYVAARSGRKFEPGELVKVNQLQVKKKKVELLVTVPTMTLHARQSGPFTLYDERVCKIEFEVAVPREVLRA